MDIRKQVESAFNARRVKILANASENYKRILSEYPELMDVENDMQQAAMDVITTGVYNEELMQKIEDKKANIIKKLKDRT